MASFTEWRKQKKEEEAKNASSPTKQSFAEYRQQKHGVSAAEPVQSTVKQEMPTLSGGKKFQAADVVGKYENQTGTGGNKYDTLVKSIGLDMIGNGGIDALMEAVARQEEADRQRQMLVAADAQRKGKTSDEQIAEAANIAGKTVWSGIGQLNKGVTSTLAFAEGLISKPIDKAFGDGEGYKNWPFYRLNEYYSDIDEQFEAERQEALEDKGVGAQLASEVGKGTVAAIPQALLALATGGGSTAAQGAQLATANAGLAARIGESLRAMVKSPAFIASVTQTLGPAYEEELANGANDLQAAATAIISTALNAGVEIGGGLETLPANIRSGGRSAVGEWVKGMLEEGKEEVIQGVISGITSKALSDPNKEIASWTNEEAIFNPSRMAKEFGLGAAVGGLLGGAQIGAMSALNPQAQTQERLQDDVITEELIRNLPRQSEQTQEPSAPKIGEEIATEMGIGKNGAEVAQQAGITPENIGAFTANYEAGKDGKAFEEVKTVQTGIDENTARQAFNAGQMDALAEGNTKQEVNKNEERNESGRNGSERQIGMAPAERSGSVPEGTGSVAERREARRLRAEEIRRAVEASGQVSTSAAAEGIAEGTTRNTMKRVPAKLWTDEIRQMVHRQSAKGVQVIPFVGEMEFRDKGGTYTARGAVSRDGKRMWVRVDSEDVDVEQIEKHEDFHIAVKRDKNLLENTRKAVVEKYSEEQLDKLVEMYVDFYGWGNLDDDYVVEEILADAYAEINAFDATRQFEGANRFTDIVRDSAGAAQTTENATFADGDKFSIESLPDGRKYVKADRQVLFGNDPESWSEQLEDYINGKIRRGENVQLIAQDGDVLTLTARTAGKVADMHDNRGRTLPLEKYEVKVNAGAHIDELAQVSTRGKENTPDRNARHGKDAENGWNYRRAFFLDFDGKYYEVSISVQMGADGNAVYNIGNTNERSSPLRNGSSGKTGAHAGEASSDNSVFQNELVVNGKSSREATPEQIAAFIEKYGAIESGENPFRTVQVPKKTSETEKVSKTIRTIMEAGVTPDAFIPKLEELVADGEFSYETITDKQAIADAQAKITEAGWEVAKEDWKKDAQKGAISKDHTVTGWALYNYAVTKGKTNEAVSIIQTMVGNQRNAAQALQATRVLKKMSPDAQLYGIQQSIERMQKEINERYQKRFKTGKAPELKVDEALYAKFLEAKTDKARADIMKEIYTDIGRQMPSSFRDKMNAWRYLAMLGNPRTHVRNIMGNAVFAPVVATKNLTATGIEKIVNAVSGGKVGRSKAVVTGATKLDRELLSAAWGDFANVQGEIMSGGKYSDFQMANDAVEKGRSIYKNNGEWGKKADSNAAAKVVRKATDAAWKIPEYLRKKNSDLLDREDTWFSQPHYAAALASYCKANGISPETIAKGKSIDVARKYAIREAQKATYRDTNALSRLLGNIKASEKHVAGKAANIFIEGIMPFKKTPANILARGLEYSPLGLLKAISVDLVRVHRGDISGAEMIDNLSAGLTGSGLLVLGAFMTKQGLIRGAGSGDDKENQFEELMGHQAYSLEVGGTSITLDWIAPESIPFFVGANIVERMREKGEELSMALIMDTIGQISDPMLEMSCIQGINDALETIAYAKNEGRSAVAALLSESITSYITQYVPTLWGQIERTTQDRSYSTFTRKNEFLTSDQQYLIGSISARFPGDFQQIPYIDAWGRQELTGNVAQRAFNNFVNPSYVSELKTSSMEEELLRLYEATDAGGVFPTKAPKSFPLNGETKYLTADEYVKYATQKGQVSYDLVSNLVGTQTYKNMSDEDKAKAISEAYSFANVIAKKSVSNYTIKGWEEKAIAARKSVGISYAKYLEARVSVMGIKSLKDENGETIDNSESLLKMEAIYKIPGLTDAQRAQLFEDFDIGKKVRGKNKAAVLEALKKMR